MFKGKTVKMRSLLAKTGLWFFVIAFLLIFLQITFFNVSYGYSPLLQCLLLVLWASFLLGVCLLGMRYKEQLYSRRHWILGFVLLFIFSVQLWVGFSTSQNPLYDYGKIYHGAVMYATQGEVEAFKIFKDYYHHFTNNVGQFLLLQIIFRAMHSLGLSCFYEVAIILGHLLFTVTILFTFLYLDNAFGHGAALLSLVFWFCFLPIYFQSSVAYTDTYSIWIAPVLLYMYYKAKHAGKKYSVAILCGFVGIILALGLSIKGSVLIAGVAIFFDMLCTIRPKRLLAMLAVILVVFFTANWGIDVYAHSVVLERDRADEAMPITLWLLMGSTGNGAYNPGDEWGITYQRDTKGERIQLHLQVINERLQEMGFKGYLQLLHRKSSFTFGSGNGGMEFVLTEEPNNPSHFLYQLGAYTGRYFRYYNNLVQCVYLSFYLFSMAGALYALKKRVPAVLNNTTVFWALAGFIIFMMLWESNPRQLVNQWPLFIMAATIGVSLCLPPLIRWVKTHMRKKQREA